MTDGIKRMLAERATLAGGKPKRDKTDELFESEAFDRLYRYLDEGWNGEGWRPSHRLTIGYCVLLSQPSRRERALTDADRENNATAFWRLITNEARRRYRDGFYADPFTPNPRLRS